MVEKHNGARAQHSVALHWHSALGAEMGHPRVLPGASTEVLALQETGYLAEWPIDSRTSNC